MDLCIIIPARYASSRFPGKPLAQLRGADGRSKSLLERSFTAAQTAARACGGAPIYIATDHDLIAQEAARIGADLIMTSPSCPTGTDRVAEAVQRADIRADIIINLQGDAPLTPPSFILALAEAMERAPSLMMATPCLRCSPETIAHLQADRAAGRVGATTVVTSHHKDALYFSKEIIPFTGDVRAKDAPPVFHHIGAYAYRRPALDAYLSWPIGPLERSEGLEQLRFLENGQPIRMVEVSAPGASFWELNNPSDVPLIEGYLAKMGWV